MKFTVFYLFAFILFIISSCNMNEIDTSSIDIENSITYLLSHPESDASCVSFTTDINDNPVISWIEVDTNEVAHFFFAKWNEENKAFVDALPIPIEKGISIHEEGMPKVVYKADGTVYAVYETSRYSEKSPWGISDIRYVTSKDNGLTWSEPNSIFRAKNDSLSSYSFGGVFQLGNGEIGTTGLGTNPNENEGGRPVLFAQTEAGKLNFSSPVVIENKACECCRTAITADQSGNISVVYRSLLPGSIRDISMSRSSDFGKSFTSPKEFSNDNWDINGCPHNGPSVKLYQEQTHVAWFTGGHQEGVHYGKVDESGIMVEQKYLNNKGRFAQIDVQKNGEPIVVYNKEFMVNDDVFSQIIITRIEEGYIYELDVTSPDHYASYPVVQLTNSDQAIVSWKEEDGKVYYRVIHPQNINQMVDEAISTDLVTEKLNISLDDLKTDVDVVCGMHLTENVIHDTTMYQSDMYGFCSEHCKDKFVMSKLH